MFRTYEPTRDRLVAVKVFRLDITPEQAQALAEALSRAAEASLFHPSIVEPIAAGIEGTAAYRAEEYVAAESLDVAMRHYAPASVDKVLPFITQLAGAIDFARAAGIGHGALHPRDVFVTPDEARATGFGVVEALEQVGLRAPVRRPYTAPERVAGASWDTTADVFSLAAIAYELLTARRPAGTGDRIGALPEDAPNSANVHQVLARAMAERPEDRYVTALSFASALEAAARGERVTGAISAVAAIAAAPGLAGPDVAPPPVAPEDAEPLGGRPAEALSREQQEASDTAPEEEPTLFADGVEERGRFTHLEDEAVLTAEEVLPPVLAGIDEPSEPANELPLRDTGRVSEDDLVRVDSGAFTDERAAEEPPVPEQEIRAYPGPSAAAEAPVDEYPRPSAAEDREYARTSAAGYSPVAASAGDDFSGGERPRPAVLPLALTGILCLLVGFAAGYAVGGRDHRTAEPPQSAAAPPTPAPAPTQPAGREWSEQAVKRGAPAATAAQPPSVAPPVPGGEPVAGAAKRSPAPRTQAAPTSGTLVVRSTPSGAGVTINGRWRGRTPLTLDNLPFARYVVRVVQPGYRVEREEVALSRTNASRAISVRLRSERGALPPARRGAAPAREAEPAAALTGSLYIASNPTGASVFIDGKPYGTAPLRIPGLRIGAHVVRMELADHMTWSTSARVVAGEERRVTGSLERIR